MTDKSAQSSEDKQHRDFLKAATTKTVDDGLTEEVPELKPPGQNDNGGNDAVLTAK